MPEYDITPLTPMEPYSRYGVFEVAPNKKLTFRNMGVIILINDEFVYQPQNEAGDLATFQVMRQARAQGINVTRAQPFK